MTTVRRGSKRERKARVVRSVTVPLAHSAISAVFSRIWTVKVGSVHGHEEER